ncbi:MAG: hypothetical protein ACKN89_03065 [Cyanobium sp.]
MRVPSRFAGDMEPLHRAMTAEEVLDGAREDMVDPWASVHRRWLALERLGVLQVLGGVAISLIALFSSDGPRLANRGRLRAFLALMAGSDQL